MVTNSTTEKRAMVVCQRSHVNNHQGFANNGRENLGQNSTFRTPGIRQSGTQQKWIFQTMPGVALKPAKSRFRNFRFWLRSIRGQVLKDRKLFLKNGLFFNPSELESYQREEELYSAWLNIFFHWRGFLHLSFFAEGRVSWVLRSPLRENF